MNILIVLDTITVVFLETDSVSKSLSWTDYVDVANAIITVILGVVTFILGLNYIYQKRREARFGFYINFHVIIKRIKFLIEEYPEVTDYLVTEEKRKEFSETIINGARSQKILPILLSTCDDFLSFISSADNNIVPKHLKKSNTSEKKEWNTWYDNIYTLVLFSQKIQLLKQGIVSYVSDKQVAQYHEDYEDFKSAVTFFDEKLENVLKYQK